MLVKDEFIGTCTTVSKKMHLLPRGSTHLFVTICFVRRDDMFVCLIVYFYRPQTKFAKVMFYRCLSVHGGACVVAPGGGHAWLLPGGHAWLLGGHAWLLPGGHAWLLLGGHAWFLTEGHAWLLPGGLRGCSGGACMVAHRGVRGFFDEIRSMSGRYASYWNAFL